MKLSLHEYRLFKVPESPIWLLSRYRDGEASKSLQWLRGWVSEPEIEVELNDLKRYREYANSCVDCRNASIPCSHPLPTLLGKVKNVFQPAYVKPIMIITTCSLFTSFAGAHHLNPYTVQILNTYQTPMQPSDVTVARKLFILIYFIFGSRISRNSFACPLFPDRVWRYGSRRNNTLHNYRQVCVQTINIFGRNFDGSSIESLVRYAFRLNLEWCVAYSRVFFFRPLRILLFASKLKIFRACK